MKHTIYCGIVGSLVGTVTGACYVERTKVEHCAQQDGDAYCLRKYGAEATFCARGICDEGKHDGCGPVRPSSDACYSPCGGAMSLADDPDCEGVAEGSSSSDTVTTDVTSEPTGGPTTMGSMSASGSETESVGTTTTGGGCEDSSECTDPLAPICGATMCVPCLADDECLAKGPGAPVCADDGRCVACTPSNIGACEGTTPVCDAAVNECVGCGFHEQCPASACDIATGACFEEDCVVEVDGDGGAEYEDIQDAIVDGCVVIVHELNAGLSYQESLDVDGLQVALLAAPDEEPIVQGTGGPPSLSVTGGSVAYVQGLTFSGNTMGAGVSVNGANLYLDRTEVIGNPGGGVLLENSAIGRLRNSFVEGDFDVPVMTVNASTANVLYSTLGGSGGASASLNCIDPLAVTVRNSILISRADAASDLLCPEAAMTYSATEALVPGTGNVAVGPLDMTDATMWFAGYNNGNFGLTAAGEATFADIALWVVGDPPTDIDGDPRPTEDATPDVAGAEVLP